MNQSSGKSGQWKKMSNYTVQHISGSRVTSKHHDPSSLTDIVYSGRTIVTTNSALSGRSESDRDGDGGGSDRSVR